MTKKELYSELLKRFGITGQIIQTFEEMSELQKELTKAYRGYKNLNHIAEEIADLSIMLEQMEIYFGVEDAVKDWKKKKLIRTEERILKNEIV